MDSKRKNDQPVSSRIKVPQRAFNPVRVRISQKHSDQSPINEYHLDAPFTIGYGKECEIKLPKGNGPDRLFEFAPSTKPGSISLPLKPAIEKGGFEFFLDGKTITDNTLDIKPGNRLKILDNNEKQEVDLLIETAARWRSHLTSLYVISGFLLLMLLTAAYMAYLYTKNADQRLQETQTRLEKTESTVSDWDSRLNTIVQRFGTRQIELENSLEEIAHMQNQEVAKIRSDFSSQLSVIQENATRSLKNIEVKDEAARAKLKDETKNQISKLELQVSDRLFNTLEQFKAAQNELYYLNTSRIESLEQDSTAFKNILLQNQEAVVYIRTTYLVESITTGDQREVEVFGTGFTIEENGLSIAPQHVMRPWLYDDTMLAMQSVGLIKRLAGSAKYTVWTSAEQVIDTQAEEHTYLTAEAFSSNQMERAVALLYSVKPEMGPHVVTTPIGAITVQRPQVGHTDITVFQLIDFERRFEYLDISQNDESVEPMDEIILIGYPLSRLHDGKSIPQGVKGFVRRQTQDLLELDTALHPGSSGAPVINRNSAVIGMAVALVSSDSYGVAVPASHLLDSISQARNSVKEQKRFLMEMNCYDGKLDGLIDQEMWDAMHDSECIDH